MPIFQISVRPLPVVSAPLRRSRSAAGANATTANVISTAPPATHGQGEEPAAGADQQRRDEHGHREADQRTARDG